MSEDANDRQTSEERRRASGRPRRVDIVSGCFFLIRRELWERLGGFDPDFSRPFEDIAKLAACVNNDSTREILAENLKARLRETEVRDSKHLASIVVLSLVGRKIRLTHRWDSSRKG